MPHNLAEKLIHSHVETGTPEPGGYIGIGIDQTLTQDATGTMVMLQLEAMELDRVDTELSVQYVDHNLLQTDFRNPDDHLFLQSACERFGLWYSRPGNGISHPVHMEHFGVPGKSLLGSDSHTTAAGALGMLAMGAGGIEIAAVMAGELYYLAMPEIVGIELTGTLSDWVSAKDVVLELLRRLGVDGATGKILEYYGPGLRELSVMDRHVIANMGTEMGATTSVFPSDEITEAFLTRQGRGENWQRITADKGAEYDERHSVDLSRLEPLIALPSSPGNVVPVREVSGEPIYQAYIGSSANPGYRDFAIAAEIVSGEQIPPEISFDINPTSRQLLDNLVQEGVLQELVRAGARIHQAGCNGCIGMGQAPATDKNSLRTVPRNFPGRSGTKEDRVYLVSPETAAASARTGVISDPRELDIDYPKIDLPKPYLINRKLFIPPKLPVGEPRSLDKGPNIKELPVFEEPPDSLELQVALKVGDDISTDEICPAGSKSLPFRSNISRLSERCFESCDADYVSRAHEQNDGDGHLVVAGSNYGQGSSREHAALAPRYLGLRAVVAKSFSRIHHDNLINYGVLPLTLTSDDDYDMIRLARSYKIQNIHSGLRSGKFFMQDEDLDQPIALQASLSDRQSKILLAGGLMNLLRS